MARTLEQQLDTLELRRLRADERHAERMDARETRAADMLGELCREGRTVYYAWPLGGKYREGLRHDLIAFLVRNGYA
jgi:hypothetical protein